MKTVKYFKGIHETEEKTRKRPMHGYSGTFIGVRPAVDRSALSDVSDDDEAGAAGGAGGDGAQNGAAAKRARVAKE